MNFDFSHKEISVREELKKLFDTAPGDPLSPLETGDRDQVRNLLLHWLQGLGALGYLDLGLDKENGGTSLVSAQEFLATRSPSLFLSIEASARVFGRLIATFGTPQQKKRILPALKEGQILGAVALSEEGMNVEYNPLNTRGVPTEGGFVVTGSKCHVVNAPIADWIAVAGRSGDNLAFFLLSTQTQGLQVGQRLSTLGYNGVVISPISLEDCFVPSEWILGPFPEEGPLKELRLWEDQVLTVAALGLTQRSFDAALLHAKSHKSGGKPIIAYQEVGFKLAEMLTLLQTAQLLAYRAAWMAEAGDREWKVLLRCAKVFCTESAERVASHALQILGAQGYIRGNPAEESYRSAKYLSIAGTSSEISRMKIADQVLGSTP